MIVFIDDERWSISGYLDFIDSRTKHNPKYFCTHFFTPHDAFPFIEENIAKIDLIVLDLMLDYGDYEISYKKSGGLKFLSELRALNRFDDIPVLIYTVVSRLNIPEIDNYNNVYFLNRDSSDTEFYNIVDHLLK